jgi:hypothetical protein
MEAIVAIAVFVGIILVLRLLGAWMLRINEVITLQKDILQELKKMNIKS